MVKMKIKHQAGAATAYINRKQAMKKLQLSLHDFRRLCILKGIYPHEPNRPKKAAKGKTEPQTFYFMKDIQFLLHEPIINKFREYKIFARRLRKAINKKNHISARVIRQNKPKYTLDTIIKERFPTFGDALKDLDDCISMIFLFATFPKSKKTHSEKIALCRRLSVEWMHYIIHSRSLRKVFISIKGFYFQAEIQGETVTWVTPHLFAFQHPSDVDYRIMSTFVEVYTTMLGFINFKLFTSGNLHYPPALQLDTPLVKSEKNMCIETEVLSERLCALTQTLKTTGAPLEDNDDETEQLEMLEGDTSAVQQADIDLKRLRKLFVGLKFFLNREVPRETLVFVIRAFGGHVSWDRSQALGSTYKEDDQTITHHIVDRPNYTMKFMSRSYVQPQWLFDSVNARILQPVERYLPGVTLPPHLSPFIGDSADLYIPLERREQIIESGGTVPRATEDDERKTALAQFSKKNKTTNQRRMGRDAVTLAQQQAKDAAKEDGVAEERTSEEHAAAMAVTPGAAPRQNPAAAQRASLEEEKLTEMMVPKKRRRLYHKIMYKTKRLAEEKSSLEKKRILHEKKEKTV